jgi:ElaB/YqjD/DUF883 family membrane-anchored ribosome-binding protein
MLPEDQLPEGTDHIIEGAGVTTEEEEAPASTVPAAFAPDGKGADADSGTDAEPGAFFGRFDDYKAQATDKARAFAEAGKDRATAALDDLVKMMEDAAGEVDGRLGSQYGDYARRAAEGIGSFSETFKDKDVDQIFDEARELVKKSPAVAIGVAAAIGFVVARIARAGIPDTAGKSGAAPANDAGKDAPAA